MFKKKVLYLGVLILLFVTLSACGANESTSAPDSTPGSSQTETDDGENNGSAHSQVMLDHKFDPAVEISTVRWTSGAFEFRNGEDIANNVHTQWMKDDLGIDLKTMWSAEGEDNYLTRLRLSLAANEPLPDVFVVPDMILARELIEADLVRPIGDAFDQYASDIVKEAYARDPSVWYPTYHNDDFYGMPILNAGDHHDSVMYIRSDWLEQVNMDVPETIEELEQVMDAFVHQDPNNSGADDTFALSIGLRNGDGTGIGTSADASWVYGAYGAMPGIWMENDEEELEYGSIQPEVKDALAKLREWKEKGYIHDEVGLHDGDDAYEHFLAGRSGIIFGAPWNIVWPIPGLVENVPDSEYKVAKLPLGPDGTSGRIGNLFIKGMILFNKDFENMDAFFLYYNNLFEYWNPDNPKFQHGYFDGYDYAIVDGEVVNGDDIPGGQISVHHYFLNNSERPILPYQYQDTMTLLYEGKEPETAFEHYSAAFDDRYIEALYLSKQMRGNEFYDDSLGFVTPTKKSRGERLIQMEEETFIKIIYGDLPLEAFDSFVEDWKSNGGNQLTEELNDWYSSIQN